MQRLPSIGEMQMQRFIAYFRVSTDRQGKSGLGLAAQREKIFGFVDNPDQIISEFVEIQSGKMTSGLN